MRLFSSPSFPAPWLLLAHGAGAGHDHPWMRGTAERLSASGISVATFDFPYTAARRKVPDRAPVLEKAFLDAWEELAATAAKDQDPPVLFAGGKSMGGRIASQVATRLDPAPAGLVFFGYPLHPPGRPADRRDRHLPAIRWPMLFLQGTRDPFGSPDEMQTLVARLPQATLSLIEGGDHSLVVSRARGAAGAPEDVLRAAADWMQNLARTAR